VAVFRFEYVMPKPKPPTISKKRHRAMMPVKPPKKRLVDTPGMIARRARIRVIIERTKAAQRQLDALAKGADVRDLRGLPVISRSGPRRPPKNWRMPSDYDDIEPAPRDAGAPMTRKQQDVFLPKVTRICSSCDRLDHPGVSCKELSAWLVMSERVLAGEISEPDPELRRIAEERARAPKKRGRRRKEPSARDRFDAMTPEEQVAYLLERDRLKTETAASTCPEPSPST
jgi:hypothetical protein